MRRAQNSSVISPARRCPPSHRGASGSTARRTGLKREREREQRSATAPASLWAERNGPGLWISTYTRNLQRQILQETAKLYPDPKEREAKAVLRKGRENYLCLLNFEDAVKRTGLAPGQRTVALALIARWISATTDGDLSGADFPAFLAASVPLRELTDRRGDASRLPARITHVLHRSSLRRARHAPIVIANHALVMAHAAQDGIEIPTLTTSAPTPTRLRVDGATTCSTRRTRPSARSLSGDAEMAELRRWLRGAEGTVHGRADCMSGFASCSVTIGRVGAGGNTGRVRRAGGRRLARAHQEGPPQGAGETFLAGLTPCARAKQRERCGLRHRSGGGRSPAEVIAAARALDHGLARLIGPLMRVARRVARAAQTREAGRARRHAANPAGSRPRGIEPGPPAHSLLAKHARGTRTKNGGLPFPEFSPTGGSEIRVRDDRRDTSMSA